MTKLPKIQKIYSQIHVVRCTTWYHLYNLKYVRNTHGGVLILVKLQAMALIIFLTEERPSSAIWKTQNPKCLKPHYVHK